LPRRRSLCLTTSLPKSWAIMRSVASWKYSQFSADRPRGKPRVV
jgi:hypothetical protein